MTIKDRGNKKWAGLMLPEHVAMLKEMNNVYYKTDKPTLDEQEWQEISEMVRVSLRYWLYLDIKVWNDGFINEVSGVVDYINEVSRQMSIKNKEKEVVLVHFESIVGVEFTE